MSITIANMNDVHSARAIIDQHLSPPPLIRSYALERELNLSSGQRVWLKDYGWTPTGSFKVMGALNWMANHHQEIGDRPVIAHSSGNFASGLSYAGCQYGKRVEIIMPASAPQIKFDLTKSFGATVHTYDIETDHQTGQRDRVTRELVENQGGVQASPYDDNHVIAGNAVGGLQIASDMQAMDRPIGQFLCQVSGGGLMAGHALSMANAFPDAEIIGVEPSGADDFRQSLAAGVRKRIDRPNSICDGLLSYDVGEHNWPLLQEHVRRAVAVPDEQTQQAMKWLYEKHGLRTEPSGAIATAVMITGTVTPCTQGDIVIVVSGRNIDDSRFQELIAAV